MSLRCARAITSECENELDYSSACLHLGLSLLPWQQPSGPQCLACTNLTASRAPGLRHQALKVGCLPQSCTPRTCPDGSMQQSNCSQLLQPCARRQCSGKPVRYGAAQPYAWMKVGSVLPGVQSRRILFRTNVYRHKLLPSHAVGRIPVAQRAYSS